MGDSSRYRDDDSVHDAQVNTFLEKAKKPIVWSRMSFGIRIEDLHPPYYEEVVDLIKRHYVTGEPMSAALQLASNEEALDEFLSLCNVWVRDTCSIVAVEEGEKKAVGVLVGRVFIKKDMNREFSRMSDEEEVESVGPKDKRTRKSMRRGSKKSIRRGSKKSIRRGSKKSIRRGSKKSIRRASKKSIRRASKKSIRRASKKSIRRASKKSIRRASKKSIKRQSIKGGGKKAKSKISTHVEKSPERRIYKFPRPVDRLPRAPKIKRVENVFDDEGVIYKTEVLRKIQNFRQFVSKRYDVFDKLSKSKYYKIYLLVVHKDYRRKGIGKTLLRCLFGLCRGFRITVAAGLFSSYISQNMFFKLGGKIGYEVNYNDWLVDGEVVYPTVKPDYSLALMYLTIPDTEKADYAEKIEERPPIPRRADLKEVEERMQ